VPTQSVEEPISSIVKEAIGGDNKGIKLPPLGGNKRSIFGAFVFSTDVQSSLSGRGAVSLAVKVNNSNINHAIQVTTQEFANKEVRPRSLLRG